VANKCPKCQFDHPDDTSSLMDGGRMSLSFDGSTLDFTSDRPGGFGSRDLYVTTRSKLGKE